MEPKQPRVGVCICHPTTPKDWVKPRRVFIKGRVERTAREPSRDRRDLRRPHAGREPTGLQMDKISTSKEVEWGRGEVCVKRMFLMD